MIPCATAETTNGQHYTAEDKNDAHADITAAGQQGCGGEEGKGSAWSTHTKQVPVAAQPGSDKDEARPAMDMDKAASAGGGEKPAPSPEGSPPPSEAGDDDNDSQAGATPKGKKA